jgi:hypothetical protein
MNQLTSVYTRNKKSKFSSKLSTRRHLFRLYDSCGRFVWNSYARSYTSCSDIDFPNCDIRAAAMERAMRTFIQSEKKRSELRALLPVVAVLTVATLAKLGAVGMFLHLAH